MANTNTTTYVVDRMFAQFLSTLRQNAVTPRYVNRGFDPAPGAQYSTIEIPVPSSISATQVTPSYVAPDDAGVSPTRITMTMTEWWETVFFLDDKELQEILVAQTIQGQGAEAVKGLVNKVDATVLATYKGIYGFGGAPGTTPFGADLSEFLTARAALARQLAPSDPRFCMVDEDAEANLGGLRQVQDLSYRGQTVLQTGEIGSLYRTMFVMNQNLPTHTAGSYAGSSGYTANGTNAAGESTVNVTGGALGTILEGDIITFAGDTQTYVATANGTGTATVTAIAIAPALKTAKSASEAITVKASHKINLLCHRDGIALASRPPMLSDPFGLNPMKRSVIDPVSGLSLTMEIVREHYRTAVRLSSLWGTKLIRKEFCARIAG